jgi:hypothetical protein
LDRKKQPYQMGHNCMNLFPYFHLHDNFNCRIYFYCLLRLRLTKNN